MTPGDDDLDRFLAAQAPVLAQAMEELRRGAKRTHWMWFVFPQLRGLGASATSHRFGLRDLDEARPYLAHPELAERLRACVRAMLAHDDRGLAAILGRPDDLKFRSSMTLFARAAEDPDDAALFRRALAVFCGGREDDATLRRLG